MSAIARRRIRSVWIQLAAKATTMTGRTTAAWGTLPARDTPKATRAASADRTTASLIAAVHVRRLISMALIMHGRRSRGIDRETLRANRHLIATIVAESRGPV